MQLSDFDFHLPEESIALYPAPERTGSRLLLLDKSTGSINHKGFKDFKSCLKPGDLLLLNDTRVIPARLKGKKPTGGAVELLLIERVLQENSSTEGERFLPCEERWRCMARPSKDLRIGAKILFDNGVRAAVTGIEADGSRLVRFSGLAEGESAPEVLGEIPLPPYIKRSPGAEDSERYQTVFAKSDGAVAAPTAGLHFTPELIGEISAAGVEVKYITLHVGPGTFLPVRVDSIEKHTMLSERYSIGADVIEAIKRTKAEGGRVVAVGTTTTRAIEGAWTACGGFEGAGAQAVTEGSGIEGTTAIFIYPGYEFKVVDALMTNFHLPCSTLIMLVSAFATREFILNAYEEAVKEGYRFYSYGDAMFIC